MGRPRLLLVDNYDSFTWNLVQCLGALGSDVEVVCNDAESVPALLARPVDGIVISPGPGTPAEAGVAVPLIQALRGDVPLLGVCLGHQAIGLAFGAGLRRAAQVRHGKTSAITHTADGLFVGLGSPIEVMRYHSLVLDADTLPAALTITARAIDDGSIMGIRHRTLPFEGVQFHPESIATPDGMALLANFVARVRRHRQRSAA